MTGHRAERGSDVEAWIKAARDRYALNTLEWQAADDLLDDYRLHADTGTSLGEHVCTLCTPSCIPGVTCEGHGS